LSTNTLKTTILKHSQQCDPPRTRGQL